MYLSFLFASFNTPIDVPIAEVTHFFCTRNRLYQRFVQRFLAFKHSRDVTALCHAL
jgi:hypothetical protein